MWIFTIIFSLTILGANGTSKYTQTTVVKQVPARTQRIIKIQALPTINAFHGHHKIIRTRPHVAYAKGHAKEEYLRPSYASSGSLFYSGTGANHVKLLAPKAPPPHVYHKLPSYGLGFPYKSVNTYRTSLAKPPYRLQNSVSTRPSSHQQVVYAHVTSAPQLTTKTSASHHSPTFVSSTFISSPPVSHIVSSDGDNGVIKEVPAPNLAPTANLGLLDDSISTVVPSTHEVLSQSKEPEPDINLFIKNQLLDVNAYLKGSAVLKDQSASLPSFGQDVTLDVSSVLKDSADTGKQESTYEVTEHYSSLPFNDHVYHAYNGTKLYYAPDPDPSLPVYKVPQTKDPNSTPSNAQGFESLYYSQLPQTYTYLEGDSVSTPVATLTPQEVYHLMHGYPAVLSQPVVAFVNQPQSAEGHLSGSNYYLTNGAEVSTDSGTDANDHSDLVQYLKNPTIHNLLHNTPESEQDSLASTHSSSSASSNKIRLRQPPVFSTQAIYQSQAEPHHYRPYYYKTDTRTSDEYDLKYAHQYEPEASESRGKVTVVRKTEEGNAGAVADSSRKNITSAKVATEESNDGKTESEEPEIIQLKNVPEVPFYSSLPSREAAETLASLQAAGSVANSYIKQSAETKDRQEDDSEGRIKTKVDEWGGFKLSQLQTQEDASDDKKSDKSTESEDSARHENAESETSQDDEKYGKSEEQETDASENFDFREDVSNEVFGKRIRPK